MDNRVLELRIKQKMSVEEVAKIIDIPAERIREIENNSAPLTEQEIKKFSILFNVRADEIYRNEDFKFEEIKPEEIEAKERKEDKKEKKVKEGKTFFYASNFSVGVNIFFALNKYLAKIMNNFPSYDVRMTEVHHIHKLDAPSGTAITLAEGVIENLDRKDRWTLETAEKPTDLPIHAIREGEVPGIHTITYESEADSIVITHDAKNRKGFALGAVLAAEYTAAHTGFLGMNDLFTF